MPNAPTEQFMPNAPTEQFMPNAPTECARCEGRMEAGLIADKFDQQQRSAQEWMEGEAVRSFWHGLELKGHARLKVVTYRCQSCGYLESYANEPVDR